LGARGGENSDFLVNNASFACASKWRFGAVSGNNDFLFGAGLQWQWSEARDLKGKVLLNLIGFDPFLFSN
jgi:hypothetical protein